MTTSPRTRLNRRRNITSAHRTARRGGLVAVAIVLALVAAACGSDDGGEDGGSGESTSTETPSSTTTVDEEPSSTSTESTTPVTSAAPLTASATGVTEDTIHLGFTTSDLEELRRLGLVDIDRGDPNIVLDALVADVNERGGINGRMLEAHLEVVLPIGPAEADAACIRLTEDIQVFAVLAPFVGPNSTVNSCLNAQHSTVIVGGQPTPQQLSEAQAPWITNTMFSDRRLSVVVDLMEAEGLFGEKVGLVVTAEERSAADDIVIPALQDLGKEVIDVEVESASVDIVATTAAFEVFAERFRSEGVDSVVLVENTGTFGASAFAATDFEVPVLIVDSANLTAGLGARGEVPLEDLAGVIGSGGATPEEEWELDATQDCVRVVEEANPDIDVVPTAELGEAEPDWLGNIRIFCTPLRLFEMAASAAGADLTHESFLAAAEGLGTIDLPFTPFASLEPAKHDAMDAIRLTEFDPTIPPEGWAAPYGPLEQVD